MFQVGNLRVSFRDLLRPLGQLPIAVSNVALQPTILALQPRALCFRALGALAPLGSRPASLILVTSRGHTTFMADSDKKYKYGILDQRKRATPPLNCYQQSVRSSSMPKGMDIGATLSRWITSDGYHGHAAVQ